MAQTRLCLRCGKRPAKHLSMFPVAPGVDADPRRVLYAEARPRIYCTVGCAAADALERLAPAVGWCADCGTWFNLATGDDCVCTEH